MIKYYSGYGAERDSIELKLINEIFNFKADFYDVEQFVSSYNELLTYTINNNDFNLIKDMLDENSNIFNSISKGITLKLNYFVPEETKKLAENEYKVSSTMELEIKNADKSTNNKKLKKIFTVFDDGKVRKKKY